MHVDKYTDFVHIYRFSVKPDFERCSFYMIEDLLGHCATSNRKFHYLYQRLLNALSESVTKEIYRNN